MIFVGPLHAVRQGYGMNSTLYASMYAMDTLGASSRSTYGIIVEAFAGDIEDLSGVVEDLATAALESGDTDTVMQVCGEDRAETRRRKDRRALVLCHLTTYNFPEKIVRMRTGRYTKSSK